MFKMKKLQKKLSKKFLTKSINCKKKKINQKTLKYRGNGKLNKKAGKIWKKDTKPVKLDIET